MGSSKKWVMAVVFVGMVAGGYLAVQTFMSPSPAAESPKGPPKRPPTMVEAVPVRTGMLAQEVDAVGSLEANESVLIRSEMAGRITAIHFSEGRKIESGAILIAIDSAEYQAQVDQITASLELAQLNFERSERLRKEDMVSPQAYDESHARLKEAQANLALAKTRLAKTEIRTPFAGRLGLRQVSPGDYVQAGQVIVNLEDIDSIKLDFRIPEKYLSKIRSGQKVRVEVDAFPEKDFSGKVFAIDPRIDDTTRTILLRARIPNPGGKLRPGMFARVALVVEERSNALLIPEQAIVPEGSKKYVYRIEDGKAFRVLVSIGLRRKGEVEITGGLGAGDLIVTAGQMKLRDGSPVRVAGSMTEKPGGPPKEGK